MTGHSPLPSQTPEAAPRIAVIVPAYGVAHLLGQSLDSLSAQTFQNWECVVIDDGAPDDVAGAVGPYLSDPRIRFLQTGNHGVSAARNTAIAITSAPLIALLDGDDLLRPTHLASMVDALNADPQARIATCNASAFGAVPNDYLVVSRKQGSSDGIHGSLTDVLDRSFNVYIGSAFRRADFDRIGGFDTAMAHCEDFDFWVRLMALGGHVLYIDKVLGDYRVRSASASAETTKLYQGMIRTYQKLIATGPDPQVAELLANLIARYERELALERAIDRVIAESSREAVESLRDFRDRSSGPHWPVCFSLWRHFPWLARPMLTIRKRAHSRGGLKPPWRKRAA